jgi:hypothetical protein
MWDSLFYTYWDYWELRHKVTFDGERRLIRVNDNITALNVKTDIYSDWKEWSLLEENTKWQQAMRSVGGDPTTAGQTLGATFFLMNGWKMKTWEGDHRLVVTGNLYTEDGSSAFIPVEGPFTIEISLTVSNLIDQTVTPTTAQIVASVLDEVLALHTVSGSVAQAITAIKAKADNLPGGVTKNVPLLNFTFTLFSASDHVTPITGRTVTAQRSLDGGAFALCANAVAEIGYGVYKINLTANDTNADTLALRFTAAGADPCNATIITEPL